MAGRDDYGQEQQDQQRFVVRILLALLLLAAVLLLIGWRLSGLQVGAHTHFTTLSENNRLRVEPIAPSRGVIRDRNGQLLAGNRASYQLEVTVEQAGNLDDLLERLHDFVELSDADIERFRRGVRQRRPFQPVLLKAGLDDTTVARIAVSRHELPGVEIEARPMRFYPLGDKFSHVVGYVGRINEQDLARVDPRAYAGSSHIGKIGIERYYEDLLHGRPGYRQVEVNAQGRVIRELSVTPPEAGTDITLTIDADLQRAAYRSLAGRRGAIVALDPNNGEVLALVSAPGFDPEMFVHGISQAAFSDLQSDPARPLFNRALTGQYPPGSTVKPLVGLAALDEGITTADRRMFARGYFQIPGHERRYRDWRREGHGWVDMSRAIAVSSDVYFYDLAHTMGIDRMVPMLGAFGLGQRVGIDATGERAGILPSRDWKRATHDQVWFPGETLITAIGQGYMLSTPLQMADFTATLAGRGQRIQPRLLQSMDNGNGELERLLPQPREPVQAAPEHWDTIHESLIEAVHARHGTAWGSIGSRPPTNYRIAGKTGTSQVFGLGQDEEYDEDELPRHLWDHALFVGYAPADDPQIAVAVLVEHGGSGGRVAAPVAREVMDAFLKGDAGMTLDVAEDE
ncbi:MULTISPECIES: penicillin-binding protein 2 [unclassified Thioalkalivibrio]|uniref:penicillin-binding protein 2 n=1 Tax=unclassified Thioalkalivibrio TaxID=2621013 RepID=UPI00036C8B52|nr:MULTISPECIES: penicillin-binding protein 2 [unclassified Thioalkalivibrio]